MKKVDEKCFEKSIYLCFFNTTNDNMIIATTQAKKEAGKSKIKSQHYSAVLRQFWEKKLTREISKLQDKLSINKNLNLLSIASISRWKK